MFNFFRQNPSMSVRDLNQDVFHDQIITDNRSKALLSVVNELGLKVCGGVVELNFHDALLQSLSDKDCSEQEFICFLQKYFVSLPSGFVLRVRPEQSSNQQNAQFSQDDDINASKSGPNFDSTQKYLFNHERIAALLKKVCAYIGEPDDLLAKIVSYRLCGVFDFLIKNEQLLSEDESMGYVLLSLAEFLPDDCTKGLLGVDISIHQFYKTTFDALLVILENDTLEKFRGEKRALEHGVHAYFENEQKWWSFASLSKEHNIFMEYGEVKTSTWLTMYLVMAKCHQASLDMSGAFAGQVRDNDFENEDLCFSGKIFQSLAIIKRDEMPYETRNYILANCYRSGLFAYLSFMPAVNTGLDFHKEEVTKILSSINEDFSEVTDVMIGEINKVVEEHCGKNIDTIDLVIFVKSCWNLYLCQSQDNIEYFHKLLDPSHDVIRYIIAHTVKSLVACVFAMSFGKTLFKAFCSGDYEMFTEALGSIKSGVIFSAQLDARNGEGVSQERKSRTASYRS